MACLLTFRAPGGGGHLGPHWGEEEAAGSPEPLWEMGLERSRQPGEPLLTPDREKRERWHQVIDSWKTSWACRILKLLCRMLRCRGMLPDHPTSALPFSGTPSSKGLQKLHLPGQELLCCPPSSTLPPRHYSHPLLRARLIRALMVVQRERSFCVLAQE